MGNALSRLLVATAGIPVVLGLVYLVLIMLIALTAIPLMVLTNAGQN